MMIRRKPVRWNTAQIFSRALLRRLFGGAASRYKLVGGFSFYNRAEVKDVLAYVRLAMHPEDDISLLRVLNVPPRGIGKTTLERCAKRPRGRPHSGQPSGNLCLERRVGAR